MDRTIQNNAQSGEEEAAIAEELNAQSRSMHEQVDRLLGLVGSTIQLEWTQKGLRRG